MNSKDKKRGRPSKDNHDVHAKIHGDVWEHLKDEENKNGVINQCLRKHYKIKKK